jgi:hypothetical protein
MTKAFHTGGIVSPWDAYAMGGRVRAGEGVFTPEQMKAMGPSGGISVSSTQVQVNVNVNNGQVSADAKGDTSGLSEREYKDIGRMVGILVDSKLNKARRVGGVLYVPRSQRGG